MERPPSREQLGRHATRYLAGASLVVLSAGIVHRADHPEQVWQYVAIAVALTPQVLVDVLAMADPERRARLRASRRPAAVPLLAMAALVVGATATLVSTQAVAAGVAALSAAAGLAVAGSPITVTVPRDRDQDGATG
jgi:hypothetical protein